MINQEQMDNNWNELMSIIDEHFEGEQKENILNQFFLDIPYFQAHGETDNILPISHGIATSKILKQFLPNHEVTIFFCKTLPFVDSYRDS